MTDAALDAWIEREFSGYGVAICRETDAPMPGEPFMSMAEAKKLTSRAVKQFSPKRMGAPDEGMIDG